MSRKKHIAILGATGHIAKGLTVLFDRSDEFELTLLARNTEMVARFVKEQNCKPIRITDDFTCLRREAFDVILNGIVQRDPSNPAGPFDAGVFKTAEYFDNLVLDALEVNKNALAVYLSSGAVYGGDFDKPIARNRRAIFPINDIDAPDFYQAVKLYAEAKHRASADRNIVDIRVFAYFSRFLDLDAPYLLSEMISCVRNGSVFRTDTRDIIRDYAHPEDLFRMILACIEAMPINAAFDQFSVAPIGKIELIRLFERKFGLKTDWIDSFPGQGTRHRKPVYCSDDRSASRIGFEPKYTSADTIVSETRLLLADSSRDAGP